MLQSMKQLGGGKKPAPNKPASRATPEQIKMAKKIKDFQSKQRKSPEREELLTQIALSGQDKAEKIKGKAEDRKYRSQLNIEGMGERTLQAQEDKFGEEEFGPDYKDLNLKPYTYRTISDGKEEVKKGYTVKNDDTNPRYREEVERVNPRQDILRVYRTSKNRFDRDVQPEYGVDIKSTKGYNPRSGEEATVYEESIKQRAEKNRAYQKAKNEALWKRVEPEVMRMRAQAEAAEAKKKAGGK
jgi:hypothetical protein|tara:strand:- start:598 stop:1323 length:726 start_codon:yes stop_codon:yes gene_type:complete